MRRRRIAIKNDLLANNVKQFVAHAQKHGADIKQGVGGIGPTRPTETRHI